MSSSSKDIYQLPPDVIAKIKSSTSIIHLNGVIVELVKNALDANARTVLISVDFKRGSCIVEDDGDGIPQAEFKEDGGLGKAHHTSRFHNPSAFGRKGLFLSSLASLALLTITSRHCQNDTTGSIIFHHSRPVARLIPAPAHQNLRVGDHGTCVTVNDLFGNMPVRVKSRAQAFQKPDELEREWELLRYSLASLLLANAQLRKVTITDVERGKRVSIRPRHCQSGADEIDLSRIGTVLTQSGLITSLAMDSWHALSATVPDLTVQAAISTMPVPSKKLQFISLGNEPVLSRNSSNILFSEFSLSDFGNAGTPASAITLPRMPSGRPETSMSGKSSVKSVNKWPIFYIRIDTSSAHSLSDDSQDSTPDSEKSLQRILDVLRAMILEFLKQQNLRPRISRRPAHSSEQRTHSGLDDQQGADRLLDGKQKGSGTNAEESFQARVKLPTFQRSHSINSGQHFNSWSRVKSAKDRSVRTPTDNMASIGFENRPSGQQVQSLSEHPRAETDQQRDPTRLDPRPGHSTYFAPSNTVHREVDLQEEAHRELNELPDHHLSWTDPHTGKSHLIDTRTGQTLDPKSSSLGPRLRSGSLFVAPPEQSGQDCTPAENVWVDNLLEAWDNPVFSRTEFPVSNFGNNTSNAPNDASSSQSCFHNIGSLGGAQVAKFRGKLRRQILAKATIISQVDQKFILVKMNTTGSDADHHDGDDVLVLVDQHAADERCRIEQLFEGMFTSLDESPRGISVRTTEIVPIVHNIPFTEKALFQKYLEFFENWGILYRIEASASGSTVSIGALPTLIAERCRLEPDLVIDLLRHEMWAREEDGRGPVDSKISLPGHDTFSDDNGTTLRDEPDSSSSWVQKMSGCPQGIIDLLNSRACRGAIMFNDSLTIEECQVLITRLARCAFPFQCAHGRPSMVPILDLRVQVDNNASIPDPSIIPPRLL
ncbi:hypothetical protein N7450_007925 [Penicillium hetheringtonii]|uniref:MutL C-terminal dimerisation domain-containing protein n=1 Tax=Penicillium hetheringtonii TaxID=911720 RepID=A0AAD6DF59_9EURO|nr:hypothetical protein N7450_007925 [Penicillium hetheringtonii]